MYHDARFTEFKVYHFVSAGTQREAERRIVAIPFVIKRTGPHVWNDLMITEISFEK